MKRFWPLLAALILLASFPTTTAAYCNPSGSSSAMTRILYMGGESEPWWGSYTVDGVRAYLDMAEDTYVAGGSSRRSYILVEAISSGGQGYARVGWTRREGANNGNYWNPFFYFRTYDGDVLFNYIDTAHSYNINEINFENIEITIVPFAGGAYQTVTLKNNASGPIGDVWEQFQIWNVGGDTWPSSVIRWAHFQFHTLDSDSQFFGEHVGPDVNWAGLTTANWRVNGAWGQEFDLGWITITDPSNPDVVGQYHNGTTYLFSWDTRVSCDV